MQELIYGLFYSLKNIEYFADLQSIFLELFRRDRWISWRCFVCGRNNGSHPDFTFFTCYIPLSQQGFHKTNEKFGFFRINVNNDPLG
jgi:hypothetical protein